MNSTVRWVCHVVDACRRRGWRVGLVMAELPTDPQVRAAIGRLDCRIHQIRRPSQISFDPYVIWSAYRVLRHGHWTVLHTHNICTAPLIAAALAGVPVRIWQRHDFSDQTKAHNNVVIRPIPPSLWVAARLATRIHAVSTATADELIQYGVPADRVHIWQNRIEVATYRDASPTDLRTELGIPPHALIATTVGSVIPRKGIDLLLRAVGEVNRSGLPMAAVIVGDGPAEYVAAMKQLAADAGCEAMAYFVGRRSDVPGILKASDVFVLASRAEAFGYAMAEALAAGVACIGSRVGGIPEFVEDDVTGLLFERNNVEQLTACLQRIARDPQLRDRLAASGRRSAERLDLARQIEALMDVYEEAVNR